MFLRKTKKSTLCPWIILLSIALICAQGVKLHIHNINHEHYHHIHEFHENFHERGSHTRSQEPVQHTHVSIAHLSTDTSHGDQHSQVIIESDACPNCLLSKISGKVPLMALLAFLFMLVLFCLKSYCYNRRQDERIKHSWQYYFYPPLRAPPV